MSIITESLPQLADFATVNLPMLTAPETAPPWLNMPKIISYAAIALVLIGLFTALSVAGKKNTMLDILKVAGAYFLVIIFVGLVVAGVPFAIGTDFGDFFSGAKAK